MERIKADFTMMALMKKFKIPDGWEVYMWELKNMNTPSEYIMHSGAVVTELFKSGRRKGMKNWAKKNRLHEMELPLTRDEIKSAALAWQSETGNCMECKGNGDEWFGWSAQDGHKYRPCKHCGATGRV